MRRILPGPGEGMVIVDLDMAIRRYGSKYGLDSHGDLMLIEKKEYVGQLTPGQKRIYEWISNRMECKEWRGWHILKVNYLEDVRMCDKCKQPIESPDEAYLRFLSATLKYDGRTITHDEMRRLIEGR
jgi:hypothetical protein